MLLLKKIVPSFLFVGFLWASPCQDEADLIRKKYPIKVIAHRGASGHAPENTMAAFRKALEIGANYIELDVHLSADGKVVVMHDPTVNRTTNGKGKIAALTWKELSELNIKSRFQKKYPEEKIPLLEEVLELIIGRAILLIEIKADARGNPYSQIEKKIYDIIKDHHAVSWCEVQSFHDVYINNWLQLATNIPIHKLITCRIGKTYIDHSLQIGDIWREYEMVTGINPQRLWARSSFLKQIQKQHSAYVWTVNKKKSLARIAALMPDGIITNYPDRLLERLENP